MAIVDTSNNTAVQDLFNSKVKTATNNSSVSDASKTATGNQSLGKDAFLQLLVTQLKTRTRCRPRTTARSSRSLHSSAAWKASAP